MIHFQKLPQQQGVCPSMRGYNIYSLAGELEPAGFGAGAGWLWDSQQGTSMAPTKLAWEGPECAMSLKIMPFDDSLSHNTLTYPHSIIIIQWSSLNDHHSIIIQSSSFNHHHYHHSSSCRVCESPHAGGDKAACPEGLLRGPIPPVSGGTAPFFQPPERQCRKM